MKIRKIGRFYDKLKKFTEGYTLEYKLLFIFIGILTVIISTLGCFYLKYSELGCIFDYPTELIVLMVCFTALSPFIVSIIVGIFNFIIYLMTTVEKIIVRN